MRPWEQSGWITKDLCRTLGANNKCEYHRSAHDENGHNESHMAENMMFMNQCLNHGILLWFSGLHKIYSSLVIQSPHFKEKELGDALPLLLIVHPSARGSEL